MISSESKAKFKLFFAMSVFGTIGIFIKYIPLPSPVIAFSRGIIGVTFILLTNVIKKTPVNFSKIKNNIKHLFLSGVFIGINWILLFESYKHTTVSTATLCYYMSPIFVIILSPILLKEKITLKKSVCTLLSFFGMILVSGIMSAENTKTLNFTGILLGLGAAIFYAGVVILNKKIKDISDSDMTAAQLFIASAAILPYVFLTEKISTKNFNYITIILLLTVGIIHTGFSYTLYFGSIKKLNVQTVAIFGYIDPVISLILSAIILKEKFDIFGYAGAALILGSAAFAEIPIKKTTK